MANREEIFVRLGLRRAVFPGLVKSRRRIWVAPELMDHLSSESKLDWDQDEWESPNAQVKYILQHYAEGYFRLQAGWDHKKLRAIPVPVYELRTRDVRVFGFLLQRGEFCAVLAKPKKELRNRSDYDEPINSVVSFVTALGVPPPKFSKEPIDAIFQS